MCFSEEKSMYLSFQQIHPKYYQVTVKVFPETIVVVVL